jgi:hypothetical protein
MMEGQPTTREVSARLRWVLLKVITCICWGFVFTIGWAVLIGALAWFLGASSAPRFDADGVSALLLLNAGLSNVLISLLQNRIRRLTGRPIRPLIDLKIFAHNWNKWFP